jgi:RNA polymerase sigma-70 factor (ECF subfamily)
VSDVLIGGRFVSETDRLDVTSFDAWVAPHRGVLLAHAWREVGQAAAEDVVQACLLRAWQRWSTFDPSRGSARGWLVGILLDRCRRHRTRSLRRADPWPDAMLDASGAADPENRLDVEQSVRGLAPRQREVVVLHYLADLPVLEVAQLLRISEGAVKAQLHDARARLRAILEAGGE